MVWPFENEPTTRFWLSTETDCSWPAAKPFCSIWVTWAVPFELANCVRPLLPKFSSTLLNVSPLTVRLGRLSALVVGWTRCPLELKMKLVPTFCQAACVPVAFELVWQNRFQTLSPLPLLTCAQRNWILSGLPSLSQAV